MTRAADRTGIDTGDLERDGKDFVGDHAKSWTWAVVKDFVPGSNTVEELYKTAKDTRDGLGARTKLKAAKQIHAASGAFGYGSRSPSQKVLDSARDEMQSGLFPLIDGDEAMGAAKAGTDAGLRLDFSDGVVERLERDRVFRKAHELATEFSRVVSDSKSLGSHELDQYRATFDDLAYAHRRCPGAGAALTAGTDSAVLQPASTTGAATSGGGVAAMVARLVLLAADIDHEVTSLTERHQELTDKKADLSVQLEGSTTGQDVGEAFDQAIDALGAALEKIQEIAERSRDRAAELIAR